MLGWSRRCSASGITVMRSPTTDATTELVVPRSMPITGSPAGSAKRSSFGQPRGELLDGAAALTLHHASAHAGAMRVARPALGDVGGNHFGVVGLGDDHEITRAEMSGETETARTVEHQLAE